MNRLKWLLIAGAVLSWTTASVQSVQAEDNAASVTLEDIDQKIRVLERKLELADERQADDKKTLAVVEASKNGLLIRSADKAFQLKLRGLVQTDGRFFVGDARNPSANTFLPRRVRPIFEATLYTDFDAVIVPDFGSGAAAIQDAYLDFHPWNQARLRIGKFKAPIGLERLQPDPSNRFVEAALPSNLVPNRDVGAQIYGVVNNGALEYALGIFNGSNDGGSNDSDTNDTKETAARVFVQPFKNTDYSWVNGLGFGVGGSLGSNLGTLPTYRTTGQNTIVTSSGTANAWGDRYRIVPQLYYYNGSFGLLAEYTISAQEILYRGSADKYANTAWQVSASYILTGEDSTYNRTLDPIKPFDPKNGTWGAVELAARYSDLTVDGNALDKGLINRNSSVSRAQEWNTAVNWYLNRSVKIALNYGETAFIDGALANKIPVERETEKVVFTRFQIGF